MSTAVTGSFPPMKAKPLPPQTTLQQCFSYDPSTGKLWWRKRPATTFKGTPKRSAEHQAKVFNARFSGKEAFTSAARNGYLRGSINGELFYAHRVIYKMIHGTDPDDIDHENGNRADNRQKNLVSRSRAENMRNRRLSRNNTSGYHGVSYSRRHKLWAVSIYDNGKSVHVGWFKKKAEAVEARKAAEQKMGYHPNHGRSENQPDRPVSARDS